MLNSFEWLDQKPPTSVLKEISEIQRDETSAEQAIRVKGAKAVLVNYSLLQHDFPFLREAPLKERFPDLNKMTQASRTAAIHQILDDWLIENTAFISTAQAAQTEVNTEIPQGEEQILAFRPPEYGRALVFSLHENALAIGQTPKEKGLLDVKGVGVAPNKTPSGDSHSNGLYELDGAIAEVLLQQIIEHVFRHAGGEFDTLPNYGVIDLGFDIKNPRGHLIPAGLLVRRAHVRQWSAGAFPSSALEEQYMMEIELLLRKYGITSTCTGTSYSIWEAGENIYYINKLQGKLFQINPGVEQYLRERFTIGEKPIVIQGTNVQLTRDLNATAPKTTLVDFTHYEIIDQFRHPVYVSKDGRIMFLGDTIRYPDNPDYSQPDPSLRIPFSLSGEIGCMEGYPNLDLNTNLNLLCLQWVNHYRTGNLSREALARKLSTYIQQLTQHLGNDRGTG